MKHGFGAFRSHEKRRPTKSTSEERGMLQCVENTRKGVGGKSTCLVLFLRQGSEVYRDLGALME